MKYFLYASKSTDSEDRQILSIGAQLEECKQYAQKENIQILEVLTESMTAKEPGRPIFNEMIARIEKGDAIIKLVGGIKTILKLERTILNILQRMSGIATQTAHLVKLCPHVLICPTRKTQWGLLDKKAVTVGGGGTHRLGLYDWILIKDNHLKISNFEFRILNKFWEIEVKNEKELKKAIALKPDVIMFDNFKPNQIKKLIKILHEKHPQIIFEASGGINEETIKNYSQTGVDVISLGALTHSTKALDISLDII